MITQASVEVPKQAFLNVTECLLDERIARGKFVDELSKKMADYLGGGYVLPVSSGSIADLISLLVLKEMNPGKTEVVMPAFTFPAQSNAVVLAGLTPHFVDCGEDFQMNMDYAKEAINDNTLCVFPAHMLGKMSKASVQPFYNKERSVPVLEDACEAMGGEFNRGVRFGTAGIAGTFSMYASHIISSGEGGIIFTKDARFYELAKSFHDHGKRGSEFDFDYIGINGKMTNMQAAIACALVDKIDDNNKKRRENVKYYNEALGLDFYAEAPHCYPVIYETTVDRMNMLAKLRDNGIECRKLMACVPNTPAFRNIKYKGGIYPNSEKFSECGIMVPVHHRLKQEELEKIVNVLKS